MDGVGESPPNFTLVHVVVELGKVQLRNDFLPSDAGLPSVSAESPLLLTLQTPSAARPSYADTP